MDAQWIASAGLAIALLVQAITMAFFLGRLFEKVRGNADRIDRLEQDGNDGNREQSTLAIEVSGLKIEVGHLSDAIKELKTDIKERIGWMGRVATAGERDTAK